MNDPNLSHSSRSDSSLFTKKEPHLPRQPSAKTLAKRLASVLINASLLLLPALTFIIVRVNTVQNTLEWRLLNVVWFWLLFVFFLLFFEFKPHMAALSKSGRVLRRLRGVYQYRHNILLQIFLIGGAVLLPFIIPFYYVKIITFTLVYAIFALGLNYSVGYGGFLNLGHAMPFAAGAYCFALLNKYSALPVLPGLLCGAIVGLIFGAIVALLTLRLRGDYLAIVTLALGEIGNIVLSNWDSFSNGVRGIAGIAQPKLFFIELTLQQRAIMLYFYAVSILIVGIVVSHRLLCSRFGRAWEAYREDHIAAESMGVHVSWVRLSVFMIGGCYAGVAGVLYASSSAFINPSVSQILISITVLSIVVLGGMGSIPGVILGSIIVILLPEMLRVFELYRMLIFGALLVIMMRYRTQGLIAHTRPQYLKRISKTE